MDTFHREACDGKSCDECGLLLSSNNGSFKELFGRKDAIQFNTTKLECWKVTTTTTTTDDDDVDDNGHSSSSSSYYNHYTILNPQREFQLYAFQDLYRIKYGWIMFIVGLILLVLVVYSLVRTT